MTGPLGRRCFPFRDLLAHFCDLGVNLVLLGLELRYDFFGRRDFDLWHGQHGLGEALKTLVLRAAQRVGKRRDHFSTGHVTYI